MRRRSPSFVCAAQSGMHVLAVGDEVVARYPPYRREASLDDHPGVPGGNVGALFSIVQGDDPWFAATVTAIDAAGFRCSCRYEDGDASDDVCEHEVRFAPGRPALWGKGELRGNDLLPDGAELVVFALGDENGDENGDEGDEESTELKAPDGDASTPLLFR